MSLANKLAALRRRIEERIEGRVPDVPDFRAPSTARLGEARQQAAGWASVVGQINPRPGRPHDKVLQGMKAVMARLLRWYGYPQRQFNRAVLDALAEVEQLVADQNRNAVVLAQLYSAVEESQRNVLAQITLLRKHLVQGAAAGAPPDAQLESAAARASTARNGDRLSLDDPASLFTEELQRLERRFEQLLLEFRSAQAPEVTARRGREAGDLATASRAGVPPEWGSTVDSLRERDRFLEKHLVGNVERLNTALNEIQDQLWAQKEQIGRRLDDELRLIRQRLRSISVGAPGPTPSAADITAPGAASPGTPSVPAFDYPHFEYMFRGSEEEIRERQLSYLALFRDRVPVLDVACGRGEFIRLLKEYGLAARGVDLDPDMVQRCHEQGLEVERADALAHLESLPDASLGGVFCAQFVEHLPIAVYVRLIQLSFAKLRPDGAVLLETQNPECLPVLGHNFYLDPTHVRPVPAKQLQFFMEEAGFRDVTVRYVSPLAKRLPRLPLLQSEPGFPEKTIERWNREATEFNDKYFGWEDYAISGIKPEKSEVRSQESEQTPCIS